MRKITKRIVLAFISRAALSVDNSHTDGSTLFLHGNPIAKWENKKLMVSYGRWPTRTTFDRLNGLPGVSVYTSKGIHYLNGVPWDGSWTAV